MARKLSKIGWKIYEDLDWKMQKIMGDQFIEATDSFGANIAEGYGRFHYLDQIKFYYNARGSLFEALDNWLELLNDRGKVKQELYNEYHKVADVAQTKLQNFISSTYKSKNKND